MKQLFKKDGKNKLRFWRISASDGIIKEESGLINGSPVVHIKPAKPKNIGRANETSAEQQAVIEAKAKYKKKLDKDHFVTQEEAMNSEILLPMLAISYAKVKDKIEFPCYVQPKLDGMRCTTDDSMTSREGKKIITMPHILNTITNIEFEGMLDGELYAHGLSFQENMKLIKKIRPESINVVYHVYDLAIRGLSFNQRYIKLTEIVKEINSPIIELVPTYIAYNMDDVKDYHAKFLSEGYEGTIIRWGNAEYKFNGRSNNLVKFKDFMDIALPIKDIIPMDAQPTHGMIIAEMNGQEFRATPKMSHVEREKLLTNKNNYIGKIGEFRYFEETDNGLPRFPVFLGIRLDK